MEFILTDRLLCARKFCPLLEMELEDIDEKDENCMYLSEDALPRPPGATKDPTVDMVLKADAIFV